MKTLKTDKPTASGTPDFFSPDVEDARRFYLDLKPLRRGRLAVVCGGIEHCSPQYAICRTTFPFYAFEYVVRGNGQLRLSGKTHALSPGAVFSYGPGVPHDITGDPTTPLVKYFVDFDGQEARQLLDKCKLPPGNVAHVFPPDALSVLFDELINSGLRLAPGNVELCARLLECLTLKIAGTNAPLKDAGSLAFATYKNCRQHVEQKFIDLQTLEQIATECHADKAYLCRLFRRYDHQSPYQYLLRLKMNHAAERLQQSNVLVKQVAEETGFADPFHFSRVFRRVLGLSPAAFRRLC
jgi:AraC-like DNA-binding protein